MKQQKIHQLRSARDDELDTLIAIDDAASQLYLQAGLVVDFPSGHPFLVAESERWKRAIAAGLAHVAVSDSDRVLGFAILGMADGDPYLDQISVHPNAMRKGIGAQLLEFAIRWSSARPLWLTTYAHLGWNKPYYERSGFAEVPEKRCGPEIRGILHEQRLCLPDPEQRIAMVHRVVENQ